MVLHFQLLVKLGDGPAGRRSHGRTIGQDAIVKRYTRMPAGLLVNLKPLSFLAENGEGSGAASIAL